MLIRGVNDREKSGVRSNVHALKQTHDTRRVLGMASQRRKWKKRDGKEGVGVYGWSVSPSFIYPRLWPRSATGPWKLVEDPGGTLPSSSPWEFCRSR